MDSMWLLNIALLYWVALICGILHHKGLLIPLLAGIGIDMGVLL